MTPYSSKFTDDSTPICRCRVFYLGSSVPHLTKDGLEGIQQPLNELYYEHGSTISGTGIDSWLSVWSNGLLLENMDHNQVTTFRFFPINTLHYCAAVRYVVVPTKTGIAGNHVCTTQVHFLPLDSPFARAPNPNHPPIFAAVFRRTTGIKVLECHGYVCRREIAANALVRCSFHSYADFSFAKPIMHSTQYSKSRKGATASENWSGYRGDKNHKIWSGHPQSDDDEWREKKGRIPSRSRQIVAAPPPPLPVYYFPDRGDSAQNTYFPRDCHLTPVSRKKLAGSDRPTRPLPLDTSYEQSTFAHKSYLDQRCNRTQPPPAGLAKGRSCGQGPRKQRRRRKKSRSLPYLDDEISDENSAVDDLEIRTENQFRDGILYNRKGHLNEKAFSYSIRQENLSKRWGALNGVRLDGLGPTIATASKTDRTYRPEIVKEREIAQMMQGLELCSDEEWDYGVEKPAEEPYKIHWK